MQNKNNQNGNGTSANGNVSNNGKKEFLPNSKKIYVQGRLFPDIRVPFREIKVTPTHLPDGKIEENDSVISYDPSGPWGDDNAECDVREGLPAIRYEWIKSRADVEEYEGRDVKPEDNGYLTEGFEEYASNWQKEKNKGEKFPGLKRKTLRAKKGMNVTQLHYAKKGITYSRNGVHRNP